MDIKQIRKIVELAIKQQHQNVAKFAAATNNSKSTTQRFLNGSNDIGTEKLLNICKDLDITILAIPSEVEEGHPLSKYFEDSAELQAYLESLKTDNPITLKNNSDG